MKELFTIQVQVTYDLVLYCEREETQKLALESYENEQVKDIDTSKPIPLNRRADVPRDWLNAIPYGEADDKTVRELLPWVIHCNALVENAQGDTDTCSLERGHEGECNPNLVPV